MEDELLDDLEDFSLRYAALEKRFKAFVFDFFIIVLVQGFTSEVLLGLSGSDWKYAVVLLVLLISYFSLQECSIYQASLGKRYYRLKVCDLGGYRIDFITAVFRQLGKFVSYSLVIVTLVVLFRSKRKQLLHDFMVKTVVVDAYYDN